MSKLLILFFLIITNTHNSYEVIEIIDSYEDYYMIVLSDPASVYWFILSPKNSVNISKNVKKIKPGDKILATLDIEQNIIHLKSKFRGNPPVIVAFNRYLTYADSLCVPVHKILELNSLFLPDSCFVQYNSK